MVNDTLTEILGEIKLDRFNAINIGFYINNLLASHSKKHVTLIDPNKQSYDQAGIIAQKAIKLNSDIILVGGSDEFTNTQLDETLISIKEYAPNSLRVIFPNSSESFSEYAHAILWMILPNSRKPEYIIDHHLIAAQKVIKTKLYPISMDYILIGDGREVHRRADPRIIPNNSDGKSKIAPYLLNALHRGIDNIYLEAGSGAEEPVQLELIKLANKLLRKESARTGKKKPVLWVGGGIRTHEKARQAYIAGADVIVTGTTIEKDPDCIELEEIIKAKTK